MKNLYEIRGDETAIFINCYIGVLETIISTSQLERVCEFTNSWFAQYNQKTKSFYAMGKFPIIKGEKPKQIGLHRWIMESPKGLEVDHINHDTLDNTIENLRILTTAENQQNRKGAPSNSTSVVRGVHWHKHSESWTVQVIVSGKKMSFGYYRDKNIAEKVAIEMRRKYMPFSEDAS